MNYRKDKHQNDLSILGFGCMRFARKAGGVDMEKTEEQILYAIQNGVNYFDTAYIYPGSESALGQILEKNKVRDKVRIATKLPHYLIKSVADAERLFNEELSRLRTDYVDYYLMHMLSGPEAWKRLCDLGMKDWIEEKKRTGKIRQIGFSYHGNADTFCALLDEYDWEFCQIQYNYMDEHSQAGRKGLHYAAGKGIPVIIMEPLRGGKLVNRLPSDALRLFEEYEKKYTPAGWAFRWLWNQKEVTVVLSGMNSMEMVMENIKTASEVQIGEFTPADEELLKKAVAAINGKMKVGCTGCGYCTPCPKGVDIPGIFAAYNRRYQEGRFRSLVDYTMCTSLRPNATAASMCVGCGKCEKHCPQGIAIREKLKEAKREFEGPLYKSATKIIKTFAKF
ncbi:MAG: aldo/keto reductase [Clostridia bacterium]|nr:aldo/keto reductase [Clostridia bacterium]